MPRSLPTERDFDPQGGGLDEQCAWSHFGGLTLEEAFKAFSSNPGLYQEDFMFMGGKAFAFYFPVVDRFLRQTIELPENERGDRQSGILAECIRFQFDGTNRRLVAPLKERVLDLCEFMLEHAKLFVDDNDYSAEIARVWMRLREHVREYGLRH